MNNIDLGMIESNLGKLADALPNNVPAEDMEDIRKSIYTGEYAISLDYLACLYKIFVKNIQNDIIDIFENTSIELGIKSNKEYKDLTNLLNLHRK